VIKLKKIKSWSAMILIMAIFLSASSTAFAVSIVGLENFERSEKYDSTVFSDVDTNAWYYQNVASVYEYNLMVGIGNNAFDVFGNVTVAQAIVIAARLYSIYYFDDIFYVDPSDDTIVNWYDPYVESALSWGIIDREYSDYNAIATRAQFAEILSKSIDSIDLKEINWVDDGAIPDVPMSAEYADAVYMLYRAGIIIGSDSAGTFNPDSTISRAEAAAIITRIVDTSLRKSIELVGEY